MYSTVDKSKEEEGVLTMSIAYTGTTKEAEQARADALQNELQVGPPLCLQSFSWCLRPMGGHGSLRSWRPGRAEAICQHAQGCSGCKVSGGGCCSKLRCWEWRCFGSPRCWPWHAAGCPAAKRVT